MPSHADFRYPAVAGQFYPASPLTLKKDIDQYLASVPEAKQPRDAKIIGMIVPHAGYDFSGQTAAYAYSILKNHPVEVIVIIGPYHANEFPGVSIWAQGSWRTPLGEIAIDENLAKSIRSESPDFFYDAQIHTLEHSLEVQIPFIQVVANGAKIVPILISDMAYAKPLAQALYKHLQGRSAYVIASTDLSHYHPDPTARVIDQKTQNIFQKLSPSDFRQAYQKKEIELCGAAAVLTLLELGELYGHLEFTNLHYENSGNHIQDKSNVVGYNASLISLSDKISRENGDMLLNFARDTLVAYLSKRTIPSFQVVDPILLQNRAVFVTLRDRLGNLRGCIGRYVAEEPLYKAVQNMSIEAATQDSRFLPLSLQELDGLSIEISVLDTPVDLRSANEIIFGSHGVIVSQGRKSGVFLPEVAQEFATKEQFLSELCHQKADLPGNCWQNPQTRIQVFTTQTIDHKK
ncbi:MAG: AmmeMemoRadiSam system protein B [Alphaproteobacteria bacterium]|nr:AmmeMemoRadiSam system protein B [Alphaproteobacteria bacterium]